MRDNQPGVSLLQALIVIAVLVILGVVSFSSGYMTASIQYEREKALRVIYRQGLPRSEAF